MNTLKKQLALSLLATIPLYNGIFAMNNNNNHQTAESIVLLAQEDVKKNLIDSAIKKMHIAINIRQKALNQTQKKILNDYDYKQYLNDMCMLGHLYERNNQLNEAKKYYESGVSNKHFFSAVNLLCLSEKYKLNISDKCFNACHEIIYLSQNHDDREKCKACLPERWKLSQKNLNNKYKPNNHEVASLLINLSDLKN